MPAASCRMHQVIYPSMMVVGRPSIDGRREDLRFDNIHYNRKLNLIWYYILIEVYFSHSVRTRLKNKQCLTFFFFRKWYYFGEVFCRTIKGGPMQNAAYNGYNHDTSCNNVFAFSPEGKIKFSAYNYPGSYTIVL